MIFFLAAGSILFVFCYGLNIFTCKVSDFMLSFRADGAWASES